MQNQVLYPTPLIALEMLDKEGATVDTVFCPLEMLDKEGATVDTVFCPPLICMQDPENSKNIIFSPWGHGNI